MRVSLAQIAIIKWVIVIVGATLVLVGVALIAQSQSAPIVKAICNDSVMQRSLPKGLFSQLCTGVTEVTFPSNTSNNPKTVSKPVVTTNRGIVCPTVAKPGVPIIISWSCGASTLRAVAGFTASDKTRSSATVVPMAPVEVYGIQCADSYESMCSVTTEDPQVRIWSDPVHVRLGARANIFWEAEDVQACRVTGPSFDEVGTKGGAATVPITAPTTFIAECMTDMGNIVSASVRVDFAQ